MFFRPLLRTKSNTNRKRLDTLRCLYHICKVSLGRASQMIALKRGIRKLMRTKDTPTGARAKKGYGLASRNTTCGRSVAYVETLPVRNSGEKLRLEREQSCSVIWSEYFGVLSSLLGGQRPVVLCTKALNGTKYISASNQATSSTKKSNSSYSTRHNKYKGQPEMRSGPLVAENGTWSIPDLVRRG